MTLRLRKDRVLRIGTDGRFHLGPMGRLVVDDESGVQIGAETLALAVRAYKSGSDLKLADLACYWDRKLIDLLARGLKRPCIENDFLGGPYVVQPWVATYFAGGSFSFITNFANENHPGWCKFASANSPNSGHGVFLAATTWIVTRKEVLSLIFQTYGSINATARFGFTEHAMVPDDNGFYFKIIDNVLFGRCKDGPVVTDTATNYTLSPSIYYKAELFFTTTSVEFRLWAKLPSTTPFQLVWSDNVSDPHAFHVGPMLIGVSAVNLDSTAKNLIAIDWIECRQEAFLDR